MSRIGEYIKTIDKNKKIIVITTAVVMILAIISVVMYILNDTTLNDNYTKEPKRELIIQQSEKVNKYSGGKENFHFNKYWIDMSGGLYKISEDENNTNVEYKKELGNEWGYMSTAVQGKFSDFNYITLKVKGEKGKKIFLKLEESSVELKGKFFTLNGKEQLLMLDISDIENKNKLDSLKEVMLFAAPGEIEEGCFSIMDAWFSVESPVINKYVGDKKDFHFNKYWEDIFNHGIFIDEENEVTTMTFTKPEGNNWVLASTAVEGKLSDFNYVTLKVKGEVGHKFLLKLEKGDTVYGEKLVELSGEEEVVIVQLNKNDADGLDSLKEVRVFPNAGEAGDGKLEVLDAWFSIEKPQGFKEAGEAEASETSSEYINGWKIEEWTKYIAENVNGLTKVTYNNPAPWANFSYNVAGKIGDNNLFNIYLNSSGCDHVMIKLRGKFKYVDPVGGFNVYEEVEIFNEKIKQGETNVKVDITEGVKKLGNVTDVVMFVESNQDIQGLDRVGSLIFGAPKFTVGTVDNNNNNTELDNGWIVEEWTGYKSEVKDGFTRISYDGVEPWASITYNIKDLLKDNDLLELKLNSNGCDYIQIKLRGKYLNSTPGYKVYEEALVFDGKLNNGEKTLKVDLKESIKELGRENISHIVMFIESSQVISGLDRKGSLDIYTPVFKKNTEENSKPENPDTEIPDIPSEDKNVVINSTFDSSLGNWEIFAEVDKGDASVDVKNGAAVIDVNNIGTENWNVQFVNKKLKLEEGANYKYSIKLKSSINRPVELVIQENGGSYNIFTSEAENLTNDYQVFEKEFKYTGESTTNLSFAINLGKVKEIKGLGKHSVYVDEVKLIKVVGVNEEKPEPEDPKPEIPDELIKATKKYELDIIEEQLLEIGGEITDIIVFVESDGTIEDVDRSGEIEILETALLNNEGKKSRIDQWTTDINWNQYEISSEERKTIVKYSNVAEWAHIWSKVNEGNKYNDKLSIIFNTNGCDHLIVKLKGVNGKEVELGKEYVRNMVDSEVPEIPEPEAEEPNTGTPEDTNQNTLEISNIVTVDISDEILEKLGGSISGIIMFVESNPYGGAFDKSGTLEIVETSFEDAVGDKINIGSWTTDEGWNQYKISEQDNKVIVEYSNVDDWAHIISKNIDYKVGYNKFKLKVNSIGCDHITIKLVGVNGVEEEIKNEILIK